MKGVWVSEDGVAEYRFDNGNFEFFDNNVAAIRGTYIKRGKNISMQMTHAHSSIDKDYDFELPPGWYSENELPAAIENALREYFMLDGYEFTLEEIQQMIAIEFGEIFIKAFTETMSAYLIDSNTLIVLVHEHPHKYLRRRQ
jgi:hypothetical protein